MTAPLATAEGTSVSTIRNLNFVQAIQHATIGFGVRRASWPQQTASGKFFNIGVLDARARLVVGGIGGKIGLDLEDYTANDWEAVK